MPAQHTEPTPRSFVDLLRKQIDTLRSGVYAYEHLDIYTAGTDAAWRFNPEDELEILDEQGILVARDGPSDEQDNEEILPGALSIGHFALQSSLKSRGNAIPHFQ